MFDYDRMAAPYLAATPLGEPQPQPTLPPPPPPGSDPDLPETR